MKSPDWCRRLTFKVVALSLSVCVPLVLVEVALRVWGPKRVHGIVAPDPVLHHRHLPGSLVRMESVTGEFGGFDLRFDDEGCRIAPEGAHAERHEPVRVALLGDSFVEAAQLPHEHSFAGALDARFKGRAWVRNYGVSSFSPVLELLQWQTRVSAWQPTHVVLMLYWNDVDPTGEVSDADYLAKAVRDARGKIVAVPGKANPILSLLNRTHLKWELTRALKAASYKLTSVRGETAVQFDGMFIEPNPDLAEPTTGILLRLKNEVEQSGAHFFLTAVPSKGRLHGRIKESGPEFADKVKVWAMASGVEFIDLAFAFHQRAAANGERLFFEEDIHFNEAGHRVAAELIGDALEKTLQTKRLAARQP